MRKLLLILLLFFTSCDPPLQERHVTIFGVVITFIGGGLVYKGVAIFKNKDR